MKDLIIYFDIIVSKNIINELIKLVHLILFLILKEIKNNDYSLIKKYIKKMI